MVVTPDVLSTIGVNIELPEYARNLQTADFTRVYPWAIGVDDAPGCGLGYRVGIIDRFQGQPEKHTLNMVFVLPIVRVGTAVIRETVELAYSKVEGFISPYRQVPGMIAVINKRPPTDMVQELEQLVSEFEELPLELVGVNPFPQLPNHRF